MSKKLNPALQALYDAIDNKASNAILKALSVKAQASATAKPAAIVCKPVAIPLTSSAAVLEALMGGPKIIKAVAMAKPAPVKPVAVKAAVKPKAPAASAAPSLFPMETDGFHIILKKDMYEFYDRAGEGVMYSLDLILSPSFFTTPPEQAWTPKHVRFKAVGFSKSSLNYLSGCGASVKAWEKRVLGSVMSEPATLFELLDDDGALNPAQTTWLEDHGYWGPIEEGEASSSFLTHFKRDKIAPAHKG